MTRPLLSLMLTPFAYGRATGGNDGMGNLQLTGRLAAYGRSGLRRDLVAGLTVAAVALPQAMAYAQIAGIPPVYGLYTAVVMTAVASLLGSSSHLINGPTNAISLVVFSAVAGLALRAGDPRMLQAVFLLCLLVGTFQVVIALLKLGDLTRYISESVVLGFMAGAGLLVALGQVPNLLGLKQEGGGDQLLVVRLFDTLIAIGPNHLVRWTSVAMGVGTAAVVVLLRRLETRLKILLPDMLIGVVLASLVAWQFNLTDAGMEVHLVYTPFRIDNWSWVSRLGGSALAIALLGLLEALAVAKSIASRTRERIDFNRQCLAEGVANIVGSLCNCMPGSGSLTRSAINHQAGAVSRAVGNHRRGGRGRGPAGLRRPGPLRAQGRPSRPAGRHRLSASGLEAAALLPAGHALRRRRLPHHGRLRRRLPG